MSVVIDSHLELQASMQVQNNSILPHKKHFQYIQIVYTIIFMFICVNMTQAQKNRSINLPKYDYAPYHFGFIIGYNLADFVITQVPHFNQLDSLYSVESTGSSGLTIGIVSNLRLGKYFDLRLNPDISFSQRKLMYGFKIKKTMRDSLITKTIESTLLQLPLDLKFKSARVGNYRMYVSAGIKYSYDWAGKENVKTKDGRTKKQFNTIAKSDLGYQVGFGIDCYLEFFKFSPEIKYYRGFNNLLQQDGSIYSSSLSSLRAQYWMLSLTFE